MKKMKKISLEKCKYYFDFDENGNLYWKNVKSRRCQNGDIAGSLNSNGYFHVHVEGKNYRLHRILYQLYNNVELKENEEIDHKDGNKQNNSKDNLRVCNRSENMHNIKVHKNNKSTGIKNISIQKFNDYEYFRVLIQKDRKYVYKKNFRTDLFSLEDVINIRNEKLKEIHGEFYNIG